MPEWPRPAKEERERIFSFEDSKHPILAKYKPKFLALGGEHAVYTIPNHPDVVVKASMRALRRIFEWNEDHALPLSDINPDIEAFAEQQITTSRERVRTMESYFGKGHVLAQKRFLAKVPVSETMLDALYEGQPPGQTDEAWTIITVQKKTAQLADSTHLMLIAGYAERGEKAVDPILYDQVTQSLLHGDLTAFNKEDFLRVQNYPALASLLREADRDDKLRGTLELLTGQIERYTRETGEILDLAGVDNLILFREGDTWDYLLIDALYGVPDMVGKIKEAIAALAANKEIDEAQTNQLMNGLNFTRTINGIAAYLGMPERIDILPASAMGKKIDYLKIIQRSPKKTTA